MVIPGEDTGADRHHRLTPDQMSPGLASGDVAGVHAQGEDGQPPGAQEAPRSLVTGGPMTYVTNPVVAAEQERAAAGQQGGPHYASPEAIFPQHAALLAASAIAPVHAPVPGRYVSVDTKKRLEDLGFARYQRSVPGLLVSLHRADGSVWGYQYRPDRPRVTKVGKIIKYETPAGQRGGIDVPPAAAAALADPSVTLWVTEGSRKADAAVSAGLCCVALPGVWNWRGSNERGGKVALPDWHDVALNGRRVILAFDSDAVRKQGVRAAQVQLAAYLATKDATVEFLHLPDGDGAKTGLDDYLAACGPDDLMGLVRPGPPAPVGDDIDVRGDTHISGTPVQMELPAPEPRTIAQVEAAYKRWLHDEDGVTTRVCHAVYAANIALGGDPVWVFLVGGSGQGKTERLMPLADLPYVALASTLSGPAALLSATARQDRAEHATGGLLRRIGAKGLLILKDFTSILEMDRTARGELLAALREVYDGRWDREVGAEGGQTLTWKGRCGFLAGCTTAIDRAYAVTAEMGPRSLFVRLPPADPAAAGAAALAAIGHEDQMRAELAAATAGLLGNLTGTPHEVAPARDGLIGLASLVAMARSPVHRDYQGEIELVGDPEAPTRIIKQLGQLWRACGLLGLDGARSWEVVTRCALDSIPKLRGAVIRYFAGRRGPASTTDVRLALAHPKRTVLRTMEDLNAHGVLTRESAGQGRADLWELSEAARSWINMTKPAQEGVPDMWVSPLSSDDSDDAGADDTPLPVEDPPWLPEDDGHSGEVLDLFGRPWHGCCSSSGRHAPGCKAAAGDPA